MRIGVISDTHGCFDDKLKTFLDNVDEIWHAGDIGPIADLITSFKPVRAVYGNIDDNQTRMTYPEALNFVCEEKSVYISHIVGYPGKYARKTRIEIDKTHPDIVVGGHSHILKIIRDKKNNLLFINPGAAGIFGFHEFRTAVRFRIVEGEIFDMEIREWDKNFFKRV